MNFSTRQLLINLLSILIALSAIMMLSYVQASVINRAPNAFPFNMGLNYVIMKRYPGQRVSFDDIVDVDEDTGVLIISRDENSETIGVYDPNMTKAFENTHWEIGVTHSRTAVSCGSKLYSTPCSRA